MSARFDVEGSGGDRGAPAVASELFSTSPDDSGKRRGQSGVVLLKIH